MSRISGINFIIFITLKFCHSDVSRNVYSDGPEVNLLGGLTFDVYRHYGIHGLAESLSKKLMVDPTYFQSGGNNIHRPKLAASPGCQECLDIIALGNAILALGFTFEELRDWGVALCESYFAETNPRMVIICPGIIDIHGYHLYRTFADRDITPERACTVFNYCLESEISPPSLFRHTGTTKKYERRGKVTFRDQAPVQSARPSEPAFRVVHLSDIHVDHQYRMGSAVDCGLMTCCRPYWPGGGSAGRWGEYQCNTPIRTIEQLLRQVRGLNPDLLIYTGDNGPHSPWNETLEEQKEISAFIAETLTNYFPQIPVFSTIGNHESYPTNHYKLGLNESREFNEGFAEWWRRGSRFGEEQVRTIRGGAHYTSLIRPGLRLISYNTQYAHTGNLYVLHTIDDQEYRDMKTFIAETLASAREANEKVIMISHHPTGTEHTTVDFSRFITSACLEFADVIVLHAFGHWHKDEFRLFVDLKDGNATGVQMMMSSVTPKGGGNPTARLLYLHPTDYNILDYENYFMTINPAEGQEPTLRPMYRFTEEYNLTDASPGSFKQLVERMESDGQILNRFWGNRQGRSGNEGVCNAGCQRTLLCRLQNTVYDQYRQCTDATSK